ncbi:4116_t:CDS:1 [Racocetra persica]|uniref:4116_t:CDS:1 n=1 Tax=Racocetra persica TaxID=160502 RepID=A0ACA9KMZ7_9GLOM|nr:4116_t:CDS:1 [Racocetra persica]
MLFNETLRELNCLWSSAKNSHRSSGLTCLISANSIKKGLIGELCRLVVMLPLKNIKKEEKFCKTLSELYQQLKGEIKKVEPKEARKIWQELYSEFCKQHSYNKEERNS